MKKFLTLVLSVAMVLSMAILPANAGLVEGTGTLTITPSITSAKAGSDPVEVIYTIKVTPPEGKPVGEFHFNLAPPSDMTLATSGTSTQGGDGCWTNPELFYHSTYSPGGKFATFEYTFASKYFQASGTTTDRNMTAEAVIMTIKATIAAGSTGDFTLSATSVGINKDGTDSYTVALNTTPVNVYTELTGETAITITAPVKGETPQSTIASGTGYTGSIAWEGTPATFAANTVYTAKVTLNAAAGYKFASAATASVAGSDSITEKTVADDGSKLEFKAIFPATLSANALQGTVTIDKTAPKFGELLTAQTGALDYNGEGAGTLSYQWYRGETKINDATNSSYTTVAADVDQTIKVEVKNSNNSGSVTSAATTAVAKADYSGSAATVATVSKTAGTVAVTNVITGQEYAITTDSSEPDDGWDTTGEFTSLSANTAYKVFTRVAATATTKASTAVSTDVTTDKAGGSIVIGNPGTITYDGAAVEAGTSGKDLNYTYTGDGAVTVTWYADSSGSKGSALGSAPENAGTYWVGVSAGEGTNTAAVAEVSKQFAISPATIPDSVKAAITGYSAAYDKSAHNAVEIGSAASGYTVKFSDTQSGTYNTTNPQITNVSDSKTVWVEISKDNYTTVTKSVDAEITPITLTIGGATITGKDYDGAATLATSAVTAVTLTGDLDSMTLGTDYEVTAASYTNFYVGTTQPTSITVALKSSSTKAGNYQITSGTYTGATAAITAVADPAVITTTATVTKGGNTVALSGNVSGAQGAVSYAIGTDSTGGSCSVNPSTGEFTAGTNSGSCTVTVTVAAKDMGGSTDNEYTGTSGTITVTVSDKTTDNTTMTVTQDGCTFGDTLGSYVLSGKPSGAGAETVLYTGTLAKDGSAYNSATAPTEAGTYKVKVTCETATTIYTAISADFTIAKKSISGMTVTLDATSKEYNGSSQSVTVSSVGSLDAADYDVASGTSGTNVDTYTVTVNGKGNYSGTATAEWSITSKAITISDATATNRDYAAGNTSVDISAVTFSGATLTKDSDYTVTGSMTDANVGTDKAVNVTVTLINNNYSLATNAVTTTVNINRINYTGDKTGTSSAKYGATGTLDISSLLAPGYVLGTVSKTDGNSILSGNPSVAGTTLSYTLVDDAAKVGQTATITIPVTASTNHEAYDITVTVTVTDKSAQSSFAFASGSQSKTYGDADFTVAATGQVPGSTVSYVSSDTAVATVDASTGAVTILKAGTTDITATASATADYAEATATYTLTVSKADLTVRPKSESIYVNASMPTLTVEYVGLIAGDTVTPTSGTLDMQVNNADNSGPLAGTATAGTYKIVFTGTPVFDSDKYAITLSEGTLTITVKPSGGGGGGGGYTPPTVTVPVSGEDNTINAQATVSGTTATVTIDPSKLDQVIGSNVNSGDISIDLTALGKGNIDTVKLPVAALKAIADAANDPKNDVESLTIKLDSGSVTYDAAALKAIADAASGTTVTLAVKPTTESTLNAAQNNAMQDAPAGAKLFELKLMAGSKDIKDFNGGKATIAVAFTAPADWNIKGIVVDRLELDGSKTRMVSSLMNGILQWITDGHSTYMVSYDESAAIENPFVDVKDNDYFFDAVLWAVKKDITEGTSATTFSPADSCTRAQMATFLWRAAGSPEPKTAEMPFTDVAMNAYYYKAVLWAVENGITKGTSDTTFSPNDTCTRGQMATFLYRYSDSPAVTGANPFGDVNAADYYFDAVRWAAENDITVGTSDTTFSPKNDCTRGQIVTFLYRLLGE